LDIRKELHKSGTELLEALGEVADDDAKGPTDALGRDLELMGYDLDCETFSHEEFALETRKKKIAT
jgi:hypothetical protein